MRATGRTILLLALSALPVITGCVSPQVKTTPVVEHVQPEKGYYIGDEAFAQFQSKLNNKKVIARYIDFEDQRVLEIAAVIFAAHTSRSKVFTWDTMYNDFPLWQKLAVSHSWASIQEAQVLIDTYKAARALKKDKP